MHLPSPAQRAPRGFTLLESLLALAVFGLVSVGLVRALVALGEGGDELQHELQVSSTVESLLEERARGVAITADKTTTGPDARGISYETTVEPLDLSSAGGEALADLYRIRVVARWDRGLGERSYEAETYRYAPLFSQTH